jgi:membrane-bound ClpP family serine protease
LEQGVIDIIAIDIRDLLEQAQGRTVTVAGVEQVLDVVGLPLQVVEPDWRNRLLAVITDPNIAYILMLIGTGYFSNLPTRVLCCRAWPGPSACCWPCMPSRSCR